MSDDRLALNPEEQRSRDAPASHAKDPRTTTPPLRAGLFTPRDCGGPRHVEGLGQQRAAPGRSTRPELGVRARARRCRARAQALPVDARAAAACTLPD